ncbi:hypothetical protein B0T13DRAFT_515794 [Neurospora crassa]|nr:hypothetical protein B0T13DRAFT_515794 [Neurospora crassa]
MALLCRHPGVAKLPKVCGLATSPRKPSNTKRSARGPGIKKQKLVPQASTKQGYCSLVHSAVAHGKRSNSGTLGGVDTPDASIDVPMIPRQVGNFARSQCWQLGTLCLFVGRELLIVVIVVVVASM